MSASMLTTEDDLCGCCDRSPCVHEDEPSAEEIEAETVRRVAEIDASLAGTWAQWPQRGPL